MAIDDLTDDMNEGIKVLTLVAQESAFAYKIRQIFESKYNKKHYSEKKLAFNKLEYGPYYDRKEQVWLKYSYMVAYKVIKE